MPNLLKKRTLKTEERRKPVELRSLLKWQAPVRPFKKRDKEFFTTMAAIAFLLAVIFLFLKEWMAIAVIISVVFVGYVLATVPPEMVWHEITTRGLVTGGKTYRWEELEFFWFSKKWKDAILHIGTNLKFPGKLMFLLGDQEQKKVKQILQKYIEYEVPEETLMDRSAKWLSEKVPLEKE